MSKKEKEIETKKRLMIATEEVFSRRGYAQATLDEIITLADTGKGTLYKYFGNKDNLFYTLVSQKHDELMAKMRAVSEDTRKDVRERLTGVLAVWMDFLRKNTVLWQVLCFEMTCTNRGFAGVEDEKGNIRLVTRWGALPSAEEQEQILRYHRLLAEEMKPFTKVYEEGIRQNFFKEEAKHEDIARQMFLAMAMIVFFHSTGETENISSQDFAEGFIKTRLYGLAAQKEKMAQ
ncbi:MAG: TetR/AcrR family transcriptional regulator [Acidaminococcaceae bacterium]|nr:TetR/AcrR family transcriptional regulator [Acidaminococcaceae bacterium]HBX75123.1 hypothetical protein [Acidaminococcaceae bacterium]